MIIEWLMGLATNVGTFIAGLFPDWTPPSWMTDEHGTLLSILAGFAGLGVWVDWVSLGICFSAVATIWIMTVGVRLARAVIAHIPLFGGSGA